MKTTNVENNPGPASMVIVEGDRGLEVIGTAIIARDNIIEFPLPFPTEAKSHTCEFDADKKVARRKYDGKIEKADFSKMKETRNKRVEQGRNIENIEEYKASKKPAKVSGMEIGD
mgnify:CR=1 FL=1